MAKSGSEVLARCQAFDKKLRTEFSSVYKNLKLSDKHQYTKLKASINVLLDEIDGVTNRTVDITMNEDTIRKLKIFKDKFGNISKQLG